MATTQVELDNVTLVRRGFEAFGAGDMTTLGQVFAADATWHAMPTGVIGGDFSGRDAVFGMFAKLATETNGSFRVVPSTVAASQDRVFVQASASGTRKGGTLDADQVLVFTVSGGLVRDVRLYIFDHAHNDTFWS